MKNNFLEKMEKLEVPQVETPSHKLSLKKTLMAMHEDMQPKPFVLPNLFVSMKKFAPASLAAVILVAGALVGTNLLYSPIASAQSMIDKAIAQVQQSKMDPAQQEKVLAILNKAKAAKDLKVEGDKQISADVKVKTVSFTDSTGTKVVLDLNEKDEERPVTVEGDKEEQSGSAELESAKTDDSKDGGLDEATEQEKTDSESKTAIIPSISTSTKTETTTGKVESQDEVQGTLETVKSTTSIESSDKPETETESSTKESTETLKLPVTIDSHDSVKIND